MLLTIITAIALVLLLAVISINAYADRLRAANKELVAEKNRLELYIKDRERVHANGRDALGKIYRAESAKLSTEAAALRLRVLDLTAQIDELHAVSLPNYKPATVPDPDAALARLNEAMADLRPGPRRDSRGRFAAKAS